MAELPTNPGSFNDFAEQHGFQSSSEEAIKWHSTALTQYRQQLAEFHGITPEDLHTTSLATLAEKNRTTNSSGSKLSQ